jgi:hypothetical protein
VVKKVAAAATSVSSIKAFPTVGLALQLEVPTVVSSIRVLKVGEECWNSRLDGRLDVVAASIHLETVAASCWVPLAICCWPSSFKTSRKASCQCRDVEVP